MHCMSWVVELGPRVLGEWMRHVVRDLCQWPIFGYGGLYGVHCMSWVVELDPRVLGDTCGMSFAASGNGLSSVTGYELRATSFGFDFGHVFVFGCVSILVLVLVSVLVSVAFGIVVLLIVARVRPWLSVLFFWIRLLP